MTSRGDSSTLSVISEEKSSARKNPECGDYEYGNAHKIKSAYGGSKKKTHPLMLGPGRQAQGKLISLHSASKNNLSEFTQRIMSAKLLRVKQVQNQLNETQLQLNELINENRILRNMQKRQEGALRRYEGNHAELPQLIRSHNEEIRTLKANNKLIKAQLRESNTKLKERENELEALRDSYTKLKKLSTEKNLLEREKLQKKVDDLQEVIKEQEEKIQVLSRKILLESKNYRHHLNVEMLKHKETQKDLNSALTMISKLETQLLAKDRPTGKVLLKRESKTVMPIVSNKPPEIHSKVPISEDEFLPREDARKKTQNNDSPESELEILNLMGSSEDTPSPIQDIFPDIMKSRKSSLALTRTSEISFSKSELYTDFNSDLSSRKHVPTPGLKKSILKTSKFSTDIEENAKIMTEKLTENIESIDDLVQKVENHSSLEDRKTKSSFVYDELNESETSTKMESEKLGKNESIHKSYEETEVTVSEREGRRNVPKRKFQENAKRQKSPLPEVDISEELTGMEQQKLATMTKTWNELKGKIQEERKKAEEKMKELNQLNGARSVSGSSSSESENETHEDECLPREIPDLSGLDVKKELRFVNFATDDAYILEELKKTDRVFNRLKNETKKSTQRSSGSTCSSTDKKSKSTPTPKPALKPTPKPRQRSQDIKSFKTESHREPKYLEEFQSEYQKQNLIKALKAIDNEREHDYSSEESENSDRDPSKSSIRGSKSGSTHLHKSPRDRSNKKLVPDFYVSKNSHLSQSESLQLEYGTLGQVKD